jgi:transposase InsO family protein
MALLVVGGRPSRTIPSRKGGVRFAVVAVDYFTKWAEVEALSSIITKCIEKFLWKNIICRYGIPHVFVNNNGKQFDCDSFQEWFAKLHIRNYFSSLGHPQVNGLVEAPNKTIFKILKKKLGDRKGDWAGDHPEVLWTYRTTKKTATKEPPMPSPSESKLSFRPKSDQEVIVLKHFGQKPMIKASSYISIYYKRDVIKLKQRWPHIRLLDISIGKFRTEASRSVIGSCERSQ